MMNLTTTESIRVLRQLQLDSAKTQTERNKLGQFATPPALATEMLKYAKTLLPSASKIRFLDPAFGTGAFYSAFLMLYPKPALDNVLSDKPELFEQVWKALNRISDEELMGEGRVYGGGLHKLEPKELGNTSSDKILDVLPSWSTG